MCAGRLNFSDGLRFIWKRLNHFPKHSCGNGQKQQAESCFQCFGREFVGGFDTQRSEHYGGDTQDGNGGQVEETDRAVGQAGNVPACDQITDGTGQRNRPCQAEDVPTALCGGMLQ